MASSTTLPTARAIAVRVSRLIVIPQSHMARKPINTLRGMEMAVTREARKANRKRKMATTARIAPIIASR